MSTAWLVSCTDGNAITCMGRNGAIVTFPKHAVLAYTREPGCVVCCLRQGAGNEYRRKLARDTNEQYANVESHPGREGRDRTAMPET